MILTTANNCGATTKRRGVAPRNSPHLSASQLLAPILRYIAIWERPVGGKSQLSKMAKDGERPRVLAPEVRDMDIDDALEEVWDTVGARQGSNRKVFIVHFDNGKSKECQYEWIYIHLRNETEN